MFTFNVKVTHEHNVSTSVVEVLQKLTRHVAGLKEEIRKMALDFTNFDAATAALNEIDAALDAVAPDAEPTEPTE